MHSTLTRLAQAGVAVAALTAGAAVHAAAFTAPTQAVLTLSSDITQLLTGATFSPVGAATYDASSNTLSEAFTAVSLSSPSAADFLGNTSASSGFNLNYKTSVLSITNISYSQASKSLSGTLALDGSVKYTGQLLTSLAGFVEPGETIENAVRRETREESGITVGRVRYHASQPWPMPHQLMIGCYGEATNVDITFDTTELEDCRWFTREEIGAMLSEGSYDGRTLPIQGTIARRLIEDWFEWRH